MEHVKRIGGVLLLTVMLTACGFEESELEKQRKADDERIKNYLEENDIAATRDASGLYYEVLSEDPSGESVSVGDIVAIYYDMKTLDGEPVEKTTDSVPVKFIHNYQSVVPLGLDYAVHMMNVGDKFRFYMPSVLAYDNYTGDGDLEPNASFIIDVELVDVLNEDEIYAWEMDSIQNYITNNAIEGVESLESGLFYKPLEAGEGSSPSEYSVVKFHFTRTYLDSTVIEKTESGSPVTIRLGSGYAVEGLEEGLMQMQKGETALLLMPSEIAFGSSVQIVPSFIREELVEDRILQIEVQPFSPVMYEVELVDFY